MLEDQADQDLKVAPGMPNAIPAEKGPIPTMAQQIDPAELGQQRQAAPIPEANLTASALAGHEGLNGGRNARITAVKIGNNDIGQTTLRWLPGSRPAQGALPSQNTAPIALEHLRVSRLVPSLSAQANW
jgi:hypothetical protein